VIGPSSDGQQNVTPFPRFISEQAADGTRRAYQLNAATLNIWSINFDQLTAAERDSLYAFYEDVAEGPNNTFTYTHTSGAVYNNVRFVDNSLPQSRVLPEKRWSVLVRLEVQELVEASA
jgi:hypothetical protein